MIEIILKLLRGGQLRAQAQCKLILQIALHPVVIAQQLAAGLLHAPNGLLYHALVGYHTHSFSVQRHRIAGEYSVVRVSATARAAEQTKKDTGPAARLPATTLWTRWAARRPWIRLHS